MKLQCLECKKTFLYAAKKTEYQPLILNDKDEIQETVTEIIHDKVVAKIIAEKLDAHFSDQEFETHVCPFCQSLEFEELHEPQAPVESAIQVEWNLVDTYLQQGYEIADRYAKVATMLKYKKEEEREVKEK